MSFHPAMPYGTERWHRSERQTLPEGPEFAFTAERRAEFERLRETGMRRNDAVKAVAEKFGLRKNDVYRLLL